MMSGLHRSAAYLFVLLAVVSLAAGCEGDTASEETTTYEAVRGEFMGTASEGRDIVVDHEAIPGFMPSMMMTLPRIDTVDVRRLERGDKIAFDLVVTRTSARITHVRVLPDSIVLNLSEAAASDTAASPPAPDSLP